VDFNLVTGRAAVGAAIGSQQDVTQLLAVGITHVVDCRAEFDDTMLFAGAGVAVLWIGVQDDGLPKPTEWFQRGIEFSLPALAVPKSKVYFHCAAGVNRGPSMCYVVLRALGLYASQAEGLIRSARPQVGLAYKADADRAIVQLGY
jgi:protein-tyrosine phosphatase